MEVVNLSPVALQLIAGLCAFVGAFAGVRARVNALERLVHDHEARLRRLEGVNA